MVRWISTVLVFVTVVVGLRAQGPSRHEALELFRKMSPEQRLQQAEKLAGAKALVSVARRELDVAVVERGVLDAAEHSDIVCRVKARSPKSVVATTIKWVIDDGSVVKKGDLLVELDDAGLRARLGAEKKALDLATANRVSAEEALLIARKQNQLDVRTAEINLKVARIKLKKYTGKDADEKEVLGLKVDQAQLSLDLAKLQSKAREATATADVKAKSALEEQKTALKRELEAERGAFVIRAPQAGFAVYAVPEMSRRGGAPIVAQGEPVREGQRLMRVCNLDRFVVATRVHEAQISRVRAGQAVSVRVDAFPGLALRGQVKSVATKASQRDWLSAGVKVYPVVVALTDQHPRFKPGMSAEVRIELERRPKALQVPIESIVRSGRETFCYVKVGKGLVERKVTTGARNDLAVEITEGLKWREEVLRAPLVVAGAGARPKGPGGRQE